MSSTYRVRPQVLVLEAEAWAAAEELAEAAGVTPSAFIEIMLLDLHDRAESQPESEQVSQRNVIPISRGRRRRRRSNRPPGFDF
jgi:hypothetical protein